MQLAQLGAMVRYELLMLWRRRSLPVAVTFFIVAQIGMSLLVEDTGREQSVVTVRRDGDTLITSSTNLDGQIVEQRLTAEEAARLPSWLIDIDAMVVSNTFGMMLILSITMMVMTTTVMPLMAENIPLDRHLKIRELLDALPLGKATYLGGKVLGVWVGLTLGMVLAGALFAVFARIHYGPYDLWGLIRLWLFVMIPATLVASGMAILLAAFTGSRRLAVLIGVALIPLMVVMYMHVFVPIFSMFLDTTRTLADATAYRDYGDLMNQLFMQAGGTMALYLLAVGVVGGLVWGWMRK